VRADFVGSVVVEGFSMPDKKAQSSPTNLERLKEILKNESLAARLVEAHISANGEQAALRKIIASRLDELRTKYAGPADQEA
jgi:hypothetical protein